MARHPIHTLLAEAAYAGREVTEEEGRLGARAERCGVDVASNSKASSSQ
jgi:hypothetical protein